MSTASSGSKPTTGWQPPTLEEMQAMLPQYQFECLLGRGGMGAVYKAVQVTLDRPVAIKVLPGDLIDDTDAQFAERFKNEARTMAKMNHPSIVNVYDFGETQTGLLYIVMEFIDGTDVSKMIAAKGKLPEDYALSITAHVCDALAYSHKNGIIHRDIKPANILINMDGAVKVADFGLAKANDPGQSGLTKTNMAMGTPDFVAPEALIPGIPLDGRADLYAIGVMLYQMLTGEIPRGIWTLPGQRLGTDPRFDGIITKAMQTDREVRYQSAADLRRDLDTILMVPRSVLIAQEQAAAEAAARATQAQKQHEAAKGGHAEAPRAKKTSTVGPILGIAASIALVAGLYVMVTGGSPKKTVSNDSEASSSPPKTDSGSPKAVENTPVPSATPSAPVVAATTPAPAPEMPATPSPPTPAGEVLAFGGHRYQLIEEKLSWDAAKAKAESMGGHLATITSKEEGEWLKNSLLPLKGTHAHVFLGGYRPPDGSWVWVTGEPFDMSLWLGGAPPTADPHLAFYLDVAGWDDIPIGSPCAFLVEWDDAGSKEQPFVNSLGMKFVPVPGTKVLFSIWDTRVQDYSAYAAAKPDVDGSWKTQEMEGVPVGREADHPVVGVNWEDTQAFCAWLMEKETAEGRLTKGAKYRLPTDAEWSTAVGLPPENGETPWTKETGNKTMILPWGSEWPPPKSSGNYADESLHAKFPNPYQKDRTKFTNAWIQGFDDGYATTSPVGAFPPNPFGLHDMGGNVQQWCEDRFHKDSKERAGRGAAFTSSVQNNLQLVRRQKLDPAVRRLDLGFRCVLDGYSAATSSVLTSTTPAITAPASPPPTSAGPSTGPAGLTALLTAHPQLSKLESGFRSRYDSDAQKPYLASLATLNQSYVANGLSRARAAAQAKGSLFEVTMLDAEKALIEKGGAVPAEDAADTTASLKSLRATYRGALAKITAERDAKAAPLYDLYLKALDAYVSELTKAGKTDEAASIQVLRDEIAAKKPAVAGAVAAASTAPKTMLTPAPKAPPSGSSWRNAAQFVINNGGNFVAIKNGAQLNIAKATEIPAGKFDIIELQFDRNGSVLPPPQDADFAAFSGLRDLRRAYFRTTGPGDAAFAFLMGNDDLYWLNFEGVSALTDGVLTHIAGLKKLDFLGITGAENVTGEGLDKIAGAASITQLDTLASGLTDEGLRAISAFKKLHTFRTTSVKTTPAGFVALASLKTLVSLNIPGTSFDDKAATAIAGLSNLSVLDLQSTKITGAGLAKLKSLKKLTALNVIGTAVTLEAAAEFQKVMPQCRVSR